MRLTPATVQNSTQIPRRTCVAHVIWWAIEEKNGRCPFILVLPFHRAHWLPQKLVQVEICNGKQHSVPGHQWKFRRFQSKTFQVPTGSGFRNTAEKATPDAYHVHLSWRAWTSVFQHVSTISWWMASKHGVFRAKPFRTEAAWVVLHGGRLNIATMVSSTMADCRRLPTPWTKICIWSTKQDRFGEIPSGYD